MTLARRWCFLLFLACCPAAHAQPVPITWQAVAPGVWKGRAGTPEKVDLLGSAGAKPKLAALARLGERPFPLPPQACTGLLRDGHLYLRFPLDSLEQLFGLGLHFKTVNQRGRVLNLHVDHYGGADNGRTHAPVPFYVSTKGYGVLINSARYLTVYAGTAVRVDSRHPPHVYDRNTDKGWEAQPYSDAVEIRVPAAGAEIYLFAGTRPMEAIQRYNLFTGGGVLPPKWGLGFTQRVPTLSDEADVRREVAAFEAHGFPLDFIGLEPGWQSKSYPCTFVWDSTRFPRPAAFVREMLDRGIRLNLWLNPYLSPASPLYPQLRPLSGSHTVWNGLVPDLTLPAARGLYRSLFEKEHLRLGISGYKIDEVDGYDQWLWPDVATFPSGTSAEQMRQVYGLLMQRMTTAMFRAANRRTYGLVRASNAGASSFPYVLYNDYYNHRDFITALCNSAFIGVLWTPEVRASKSAEEWLRRMQSVCFSPMAMLNAWADGTKPWSYPEVEAQVREVALWRMRLFPYLYTAFAQYCFEGIPPIRPMSLVEGYAAPAPGAGKLDATDNPYRMALRHDISDQYMLGDDLLVAPLFSGERSRKVILPPGKWYDFYSGRYAGGGGSIDWRPDGERIPLFVRDGAVIPLIPAVTHTPRRGQQFTLELRHYGTAPGSCRVYDDDGETYDYEQGRQVWYRFTASRDRGGRWQGERQVDNPAQMPLAYPREQWTFMAADRQASARETTTKRHR